MRHPRFVRKPAALPPSLQGRPFTVVEASALEVSRRRTRAGDLARPFRGVRAPAGELDVTGLCRAYAQRMRSDQFFSHSTAARLLGLPLPARFDADARVHVTSISSRQPRMRGVVGHLDRDAIVRVTSVGGLRVASAADTWCRLASVLTLDEMVILGDAVVRRKRPLATMAELGRAVAGHAGRRGCQRLREAFVEVRPGTDSPRETRTRLILVRAGLPEPRINWPITNRHGAFLALGDLAYPDFRVLIEYDGGTHFGDDAQAYHDIDRLDAVMAEGWRVIRLNKTHGSAAIVSTVRRALVDAGWTP